MYKYFILRVKYEWYTNLTKLHKYLSISSLSLDAAICRAVFPSSILLKSAYSGNLVIHSSIALHIDNNNYRNKCSLDSVRGVYIIISLRVAGVHEIF